MASYESEEAWNGEEEEEEEEQDQQKQQKHKEKKNNVLPIWGNERTMNLNPLILTNIQSSYYFKVDLYELKTYHEVIDEIYYKVQHLEPWEKGSRKTAGQTGMCGGVRGVGAGGIVSTAFCLLYKLFTLKLTRKQVNGLITHQDSPYIRGLGFMYIRYTQPPADLWEWYDPYLDDAEEIDVKAGGGLKMTIGTMLKNFLTKLEWFSTLFPRIPVPIQHKLQKVMAERFPPAPVVPGRPQGRQPGASKTSEDVEAEKYGRRRESPPKGSGRERERFSREIDRERNSRDNLRDGSSFLRDSYRDRDVKPPHRDADRDAYFDRDRERERDRNRSQRDRSRDRERQRRHDPRDDRDRSHRRRENSREREREHRRHRDHDPNEYRHRSSNYR